MTAQTIATATPNEHRILRRAEVEAKTGFKRAHIYNPLSIRLRCLPGERLRCSAQSYQASKPAAGDNPPVPRARHAFASVSRTSG